MAEKKPPRRRAHKSKPTERALLFAVRKIIDASTGEEIKCLVPYSAMDRKLLNERAIRTGDVLVVDAYKERNYRFWRLWHQLATYMIENHRAFEGMKSHPALKRLQLEAGIMCELQEIDLGELGLQFVKVAKSLNFEDTDEGQAQEVWTALCDHVMDRYFGDWTEEQQEMARAHWEREEQ